MPASLRRPASSSGACRASSSIARVIEAMRISLDGSWMTLASSSPVRGFLLGLLRHHLGRQMLVLGRVFGVGHRGSIRVQGCDASGGVELDPVPAGGAVGGRRRLVGLGLAGAVGGPHPERVVAGRRRPTR